MTSSSSMIEVVVHYCETGDVQHLSFRQPFPGFAELAQQIAEYAEPGVCCTSLVLLQADGSFLTNKSPALACSVVLRMFSRQIIDPKFTSKATGLQAHHEAEEDDLIMRDLADTVRQRLDVLRDAGEVLKVHAARELDRSSFARLGEPVYAPYAQLMREDFPHIPAYLDALKQVSTGVNTTLLDAINLDRFHQLADTTQQRHSVIEAKLAELVREEHALRHQLEHDLAWPPPASASSSSSSLSGLQRELNELAQALFGLLRKVAAFDSHALALKKHLLFLQEHIALQRQFLQEVGKIRLFPSTYGACVAEAARRRKFAARFSAQVQQVSQYLARDRDAELVRRERFHHDTFRLMPVAGLFPGLEAAGVLPPVEINQRAIDPLLFVQQHQDDEHQQEVEQEEEEQEDAVLSAIEVLELKAENEMLRGSRDSGGGALAALKRAHSEEVEALERRILELEEFMAAARPVLPVQQPKEEEEEKPTVMAASYMQFEEDPD